MMIKKRYLQRWEKTRKDGKWFFIVFHVVIPVSILGTLIETAIQLFVFDMQFAEISFFYLYKLWLIYAFAGWLIGLLLWSQSESAWKRAQNEQEK